MSVMAFSSASDWIGGPAGTVRSGDADRPGAVALFARDLVEELVHGLADALQPSRLHHRQIGLATYQPSAVTWYLAR